VPLVTIDANDAGCLRWGQSRKSRLVMMRSALLPKPDIGSLIYECGHSHHAAE
jgi:hypothetical protein